jgi:hypothetical protein
VPINRAQEQATLAQCKGEAATAVVDAGNDPYNLDTVPNETSGAGFRDPRAPRRDGRMVD